MKNLITICIAIAIISVIAVPSANAEMSLSIVAGEDLDPQDFDIILEPSDILQLGIHSTTGFSGSYENTYWFMTTADTATISGGTPTLIAPMNSNWYGDDAELSGEIGSWGFIGNYTNTPVDPGIYIENILLHCDATGDVTINLWSSPDFIEFTLEDSLTIRQVPEPTTIALFGLGAALIRRRRS